MLRHPFGQLMPEFFYYYLGVVRFHARIVSLVWNEMPHHTSVSFRVPINTIRIFKIVGELNGFPFLSCKMPQCGIKNFLSRGFVIKNGGNVVVHLMLLVCFGYYHSNHFRRIKHNSGESITPLLRMEAATVR